MKQTNHVTIIKCIPTHQQLSELPHRFCLQRATLAAASGRPSMPPTIFILAMGTGGAVHSSGDDGREPGALSRLAGFSCSSSMPAFSCGSTAGEATVLAVDEAVQPMYWVVTPTRCLVISDTIETLRR